MPTAQGIADSIQHTNNRGFKDLYMSEQHFRNEQSVLRTAKQVILAHSWFAERKTKHSWPEPRLNKRKLFIVARLTTTGCRVLHYTNNLFSFKRSGKQFARWKTPCGKLIGKPRKWRVATACRNRIEVLTCTIWSSVTTVVSEKRFSRCTSMLLALFVLTSIAITIAWQEKHLILSSVQLFKAC